MPHEEDEGCIEGKTREETWTLEEDGHLQVRGRGLKHSFLFSPPKESTLPTPGSWTSSFQTVRNTSLLSMPPDLWYFVRAALRDGPKCQAPPFLWLIFEHSNSIYSAVQSLKVFSTCSATTLNRVLITFLTNIVTSYSFVYVYFCTHTNFLRFLN